jgi:hypothetical protein
MKKAANYYKFRRGHQDANFCCLGVAITIAMCAASRKMRELCNTPRVFIVAHGSLAGRPFLSFFFFAFKSSFVNLTLL